jgi:hypothetical protein
MVLAKPGRVVDLLLKDLLDRPGAFQHQRFVADFIVNSDNMIASQK